MCGKNIKKKQAGYLLKRQHLV